MGECPPVFVLGLIPRCGSNFLHDLLVLHPGCQHSGIIWEDHFVQRSHYLEKYVSSLFGNYSPRWAINTLPGARDALRRELGAAVLRFNHSQREIYYRQRGKELAGGRRLVTKTPNVEGLELYFQYFPDVPLIIVVRDGRSAVASGMRSLGWDFEKFLHDWKVGAGRIMDLQAARPDSDGFRVVRYEDLVRDRRTVIRGLLGFLGLPEADYPFDEAERAKVRGSSESENLDWMPREAPPGFDPLNRWKQCSPEQLARFESEAGDGLRHFGYL